MKPFRYVQSFVDRKTGAVFHYFRRRGYPRIRLPGIPGSCGFMEAYQRALESQQMPIGATRTKAGTVNAAIVGYYGSSLHFQLLAPSTQQIRRWHSGTISSRAWRQVYRRYAAEICKPYHDANVPIRGAQLAQGHPSLNAICGIGRHGERRSYARLEVA